MFSPIYGVQSLSILDENKEIAFINRTMKLFNVQSDMCPREELNSHFTLRTGLFYPLNYGDKSFVPYHKKGLWASPSTGSGQACGKSASNGVDKAVPLFIILFVIQ